MNLLQSTNVITFSMTHLIVTLCSQNKGQYYLRVVSFLIQQLNLYVDECEKGTSPLSTISHILTSVLSEEKSTREIGAKNGIFGVTLGLLTNLCQTT
jgi:hypothetical protein